MTLVVLTQHSRLISFFSHSINLEIIVSQMTLRIYFTEQRNSVLVCKSQFFVRVCVNKTTVDKLKLWKYYISLVFKTRSLTRAQYFVAYWSLIDCIYGSWSLSPSKIWRLRSFAQSDCDVAVKMSMWNTLTDSNLLEVFDSVLLKCDGSYCKCKSLNVKCILIADILTLVSLWT